MSRSKLITFICLAGLIALAIYFDLHKTISIENFRTQQADLSSWVAANPGLAIGSFFGIYVAITALNIPGAAAMSLVAGALFGTFTGTILVSFASTIGASLAFLLARYLLRDFVESRFSSAIQKVNAGIAKDGNLYLFTLRLVPLFPFFVINAVMGLTRLPLKSFYWVSQLGMFPATVVYVNAGTQLGKIDGTNGILSLPIIASFAALGLLPLVVKKFLDYYQMKRQQKNFPKPKQFDTNLVVIGAGSGGLVTAYIAAAAKARVTLIERAEMGGDCLNTGCVPSKALIRSSRVLSYMQRAKEFGLRAESPSADFAAVMQRVKNVISKIEPHDSVERYTELGVDCIKGEARITSPWTVDVNGETIRTRSIVIATGGRPAIPPIPGLAELDFRTSDDIWELPDLPARLLVLGGGAIGCELAQAFSRLGSDVTLVEMQSHLLINEDTETSAAVETSFAVDGINVMTNSTAVRFEKLGAAGLLTAETPEGEQQIEFDQVLVATGRKATTENLGLDILAIKTNHNGTIPVNKHLQTIYPNIFACGDVAGPYQLTHAAAHQAWYCAMNALYGKWWKFSVDYSVLPRAVFCDPEVASVGLSEAAAKEAGVDYEVTHYGIDDLDRAIADGEAHGFVKVLTPPGKDKILGVTIVGSHAGDIISEYTLAMRHNLGLGKILSTVHIYPTLAEANKFAAGNWRKNNLSEKLLRLSRWFNQRQLN
jgi:dihydrolipoamide dehydrogenase